LSFRESVDLQRDWGRTRAVAVDDLRQSDLAPLAEDLAYRHITRHERHASVSKFQFQLGRLRRCCRDRERGGEWKNECEPHVNLQISV
jgi:hypothetical protein